LTADAGELYGPAMVRPAVVRVPRPPAAERPAFPRWLPWVAVFFLGTASGITGVLAWQAAFPPTLAEIDLASAGHGNSAPDGSQSPGQPAVAPRPHAAPASTGKPESPKPEPKVAPGANPPEPVPPQGDVTITLNEPDAEYILPPNLQKGRKVILRGRVKKFTVPGLSDGAAVDASALEATSVSLGGRIDGRAVLKVNSPTGSVQVAATVTGKASVGIAAAGGVVQFTPANPANAQIDGGSVVTIAAKSVDIGGEVNGIETTVTVNVPSNGVLRVAAVRGIATVQYRVTDDRGSPEIVTGPVSPTANFKKIE
jgi:hypothetical protein